MYLALVNSISHSGLLGSDPSPLPAKAGGEPHMSSLLMELFDPGEADWGDGAMGRDTALAQFCRLTSEVLISVRVCGTGWYTHACLPS